MLAKSFPKESYSQLFDDFFSLDTARWTSIDDGGTGTGAVLTAAGSGGGVLSAASAGAVNDYHGYYTPALFEFLARRPVVAELRFKITESAANTAHWAFGLTDTVTGGWLVDTTGAQAASYKGAMIWKPKAATTIKAETSNVTAKSATQTVGAFTSGSWETVGLEFDPGDGVTGWVQFRHNGMGSDATAKPLPRLPITLAGLAPMSLMFVVKASTTSAETMLVDYAGGEIYRG